MTEMKYYWKIFFIVIIALIVLIIGLNIARQVFVHKDIQEYTSLGQITGVFLFFAAAGLFGIAVYFLFGRATARKHELKLRKKIEEELLQEKKRMLVTLGSIEDMVVTTDIRGRITY